jgi:predicted DNA-binding transcriptional regulator AlpA
MVKPRLRYRDLKARGVINNRPTLQNWIKKRGFPRGQLTGPNTRTWTEEEVGVWLDNRPVAPKPIPPVGPGKRRGRPPKLSAAGPEAVS